jgi:carboxyl-terminal processing protease
MRRTWAGIGGLVFLLAIAFLVGLLSTRSDDANSADAVRPTTPDPRTSAIAEEVRYALRTSYYRHVEDDVLAGRSVKAILAALDDPYTEYLSQAEYGLYESSTSGRYTGVGLHILAAKHGLRVTSVFEGPAKEAGMKRGDLILAIDGRSVEGMRFGLALTLMQGAAGTTVNLAVKRRELGTLRFTLVRQELPAPSSRVKMLRAGGANVGYVRLLSFTERTSTDLRASARQLVQAGAGGLVLDLRDNPGGLLIEAVRTVSLFLEEGVVCTTEGVHQARREYEASGSTAFADLPVVVLVNRGSASASEIVAAALAEHGRAVVVGQRTYGKAAVQSLRELSNGGVLKLTTATYKTPRGRNLFGTGFRPHFRAIDDPATPSDEALLAAQRAALQAL